MSSMYVTVALWLLLLAWPAIAVIVDGAAGIRAHGLRYTFGTATRKTSGSWCRSGVA